MKNKEYIKLPKISNQKIRQKYYISESITHPAKANIPMMHWILKKFVQDGDIVLDPMAGIFTTGIEGMRLFPNSVFIGIELEDKFLKMIQANIEKVKKIADKDMFMKIGRAVAVQGDARQLKKILKEKVNKIISSPPWGGQVQHKTNYLGKQKRESGFEYSDNPENIGNMPHGKIDKIITSPPYSESLQAKPKEQDPEKLKNLPSGDYSTPGRMRSIKIMGTGYSGSKENIGNLSHGNIDKIITSPPFGQTQEGGGIAKKGYDGPKHTPTDMIGKRSYMPKNIGDDKNISNKLYGQIDKVVTSPPYGEGTGHGSSSKRPIIKEKALYLYGKGSYSDNKDNIGSSTGQTYLESMQLVYQQCYQVLNLTVS